MRFNQGWKPGWTKRALCMWVIDLILYKLVLLVGLGLAVIGLNLYLKFNSVAEFIASFGVIASLSLGALLLLALIAAAVFDSLLRNFFVSSVALDNQSVGAAFKAGCQLF